MPDGSCEKNMLGTFLVSVNLSETRRMGILGKARGTILYIIYITNTVVMS